VYLEHYKLDLKPFEMSPDPRFLWMGEKHKEALAALEYGILESKGFLLLTGEAGTGKTVLINGLLKSTRVSAVIATIPDPDLEILDFFNVLAEEFQMNKTFETKGSFLIEFKHFLHEVYQSEGKVLLIIDESQRLNHELLEQIRILSNIELNDRKLINIFFVGQSEFFQTLREERNVAVRKRLAVSYHLDPLDLEETEKYIDHRLKIAGADENLFTPEAMRDIFYFTGGLPRLINITCDHALLIGYAKELEQIDETVIAECRKDLQILSDPDRSPEQVHDFEYNQEIFEGNQEINEYSESPEEAQGGKKIWPYAIFVAAFFLIAYLIFNFGWKNPSVIETRERIYSPKNSPPEKESPESENVHKGDLDNEKASKNDQTRTTAVQEKSDETGAENVSSAPEGDAPVADAAPPAGAVPAAPPKTIIEFGHNSMRLSDEAHEKLEQFVKFSSSHPESEIIVEGYSDSRGDPIYNQNLSKMRAEVVKKYLVDKGLPAEKIVAVGRGPQNPIADNETVEGRKQNRRIEIRVKVD
jgi:general secretion pathway protein A